LSSRATECCGPNSEYETRGKKAPTDISPTTNWGNIGHGLDLLDSGLEQRPTVYLRNYLRENIFYVLPIFRKAKSTGAYHPSKLSYPASEDKWKHEVNDYAEKFRHMIIKKVNYDKVPRMGLPFVTEIKSRPFS